MFGDSGGRGAVGGRTKIQASVAEYPRALNRHPSTVLAGSGCAVRGFRCPGCAFRHGACPAGLAGTLAWF